MNLNSRISSATSSSLGFDKKKLKVIKKLHGNKNLELKTNEMRTEIEDRRHIWNVINQSAYALKLFLHDFRKEHSAHE